MDLQEKAEIRIGRMDFSTRQLDFIWADWENWDEHINWLLVADKKEILDWISANDPVYKAAAALRSIPSDKRSQASRNNGKKGGRPRKNQ